MTRHVDSQLPTTIGAAFPGWRAWRTRDGELASREGGSPPQCAHARGESLAELTHAIEAVIKAGPPPLRPAERAAAKPRRGPMRPLASRISW